MRVMSEMAMQMTIEWTDITTSFYHSFHKHPSYRAAPRAWLYRLTDWVGILSEGLKIAPPEAPVTGYMFGKGVYFADICSKSANYCFATRSKNVGLLLLCDVSLGTMNDLLAADYDADQLLRGKQSVMGKGRIALDPGNIHQGRI
ncbi:poly [ADP-ribose] polymerase 2-like [Corticium candelabrum]|uniref:poly [ADP-ribose] polymerase 2-like n=1 Tax=Corticium candelabrum TaxID=121492 RepID=UPI002E260D2A|nr:poly [ADP-ribose] polymerase 2-like [Corticium candelabrum]